MRGTSPEEIRQLHLEGALKMKEGKDSRVSLSERASDASWSPPLSFFASELRRISPPPAGGRVLRAVHGPAAHHQAGEARGEGQDHPPATPHSQCRVQGAQRPRLVLAVINPHRSHVT